MSAPAAERLSRLLSLVPWLDQNSGIPVADAAAHFGVSPAQLERDLWLLVCCGLPGHGPDQLIDIQFWDDDGRIHVIDPQTLQRPLALTADEVTALLIGLRMLAQVPGEHDRGALAGVTAKLEDVAAEVPVDRIVIADAVSEDVRTAVEDAVRRQRALEIEYLGATRDQMTTRVIDVQAVLHRDGHAYLDAWCRSAEAMRSFRVDRITRAQVLEEPLRPVPQDAASGIFAPEGADVVEVVLDFTPAGRWILDLLRGDVVAEDPDGSGTLRARVADPAWLVRIVLAQGGDVVVRDPADLRAQVRAAAEAALAGYGEPGPLSGRRPGPPG